MNILHRSDRFVVSGNQAIQVIITDHKLDRSFILVKNDLLAFNMQIRYLNGSSWEPVVTDTVNMILDAEKDKQVA